ncbi:MAG: hypothetical protein IBX55_15985 [Methyloprofundus sp.]|nr:hypothetical protein [Methyloprofundus sp.]
MNKVSLKYIEIAADKSGLSHYAIAKKIGVTPQQINALKHRDIELKDDALIRLAQIAQLNPLEVLAEKHIQNAKGNAEAAFWATLAKSKAAKDSLIDCILC